MSVNNQNHYLGLGKVIYSSNVTHLDPANNYEPEIFLTERITRQKASGAWPTNALLEIKNKLDLDNTIIHENRDVRDPLEFEENLNKKVPFFDFLKNKGLDHFTRHHNKDIKYLSHHACHAYSALMMSPFEKSLIIVLDGAGSERANFYMDEAHIDEHLLNVKKDAFEECSVFLQDGPQIHCVLKNWQFFKKSNHPPHEFSNGIGMFYEKMAEFIFNNNRSAGKVMGLAPFGTPRDSEEYLKLIFADENNPEDKTLYLYEEFLNKLDWTKQYQGQSKEEWSNHENLQLYKDLAATVQEAYQFQVFTFAKSLREIYSDYNNLIITGGTALNCTSNTELYKFKVFDNIYIPPFPSDESISVGCAYFGLIKDNPEIWKPNTIEKQHGFFGPKSSVANEEEILNCFENFKITKVDDIAKESAKLLNDNKIIAWFQGRSESGPRALGHRSILASPQFPNLKDYLNQNIKFREDFRPYGCSVPQEYASVYFTVKPDFQNPYMSFAPLIKYLYLDKLKEVSHVNSTSRMQTVTEEQNSIFYRLLKEFGDISGLYCLLNTSLNIMGEPIVETIVDAKNFFEKSKVDYLVVENFIIEK